MLLVIQCPRHVDNDDRDRYRDGACRSHRHRDRHVDGYVAAGPPACATSSLHVTQGTPQGYAGGVYQAIIFTNAGGASCTLYGYPGVSLVSASRAQIGLAASRSSVTPVKLITLAPGATASAQLQIVDALNFPASTCNPVKAAYLRIYPPNQTVAVYLANTSQTCSKPVQTLRISAVNAGLGS